MGYYVSVEEIVGNCFVFITTLTPEQQFILRTIHIVTC
jgi:hypothetical protein